MNVTTPSEISAEILTFCRNLVPGSKPAWVDCRALPHAQVNSCYENVQDLVRNRGGSASLGWIIWEWPGIVLEAEFHAVWRNPDGELIDPTPKQDGERRILFLPDPDAVDEGGVVPSRYETLCDWEEVGRFVTVCLQNAERLAKHHEGHRDDPSIENARRRKESAEAIHRRQGRESLSSGLTLSEADARRRHEASRGDVEASVALARHLASRGEFRPAFETLVRTADESQRRAEEVRPTIVSLFQACGDQALVAEYQRQFASLLH